MVDLLEVAQSWFRKAKHTHEQKALADERLLICNTCDEKAFNDTLKFFKCNACGCPLSAKVYSIRGPIACPKHRWER